MLSSGHSVTARGVLIEYPDPGVLSGLIHSTENGHLRSCVCPVVYADPDLYLDPGLGAGCRYHVIVEGLKGSALDRAPPLSVKSLGPILAEVA